jgi:hypothetical protein
LFGQGPNASFGGFAGGLAGGVLGDGLGFGLSLVGTAIGSEFDKAVTNAKLLGEALQAPIEKFKELADAGLLSSLSLQKNIQALIDGGKQAEAAVSIQQDLSKTYGDLGASESLFNTNRQLTESWNKLGIALAGFKDGPLTGVIKFIQSNSEYAFQSGRSKNIEDQLIKTGKGSLVNSMRKELAAPDAQYDVKRVTEIIDKYAVQLPAYKAITAELNKAQKIRETINNLTYKQIAADSQGNKSQSFSLQLAQLKLDTEEKTIKLKADRNYFTDNDPKKGLTEAGKLLNEQNNIAKQKILQAQAQFERQLNADNEASANRIAAIKRQAAIETKTIDLSNIDQQRAQAREKLNAAIDAQRTAQASYDAMPSDNGRLNAKNETNANRQKAETEFSAQQIKFNREDVTQGLASKTRIRDLQAQTQLQLLRPGLGGPGQQALGALDELRRVREAALEAERQRKISPGNTDLIRASQEANAKLVEAAAKTKADLIEAYQAAKNAALAISRSTEDSKLNLLSLQGGSSGINAFLDPTAREARQREAFTNLLPQFEKARQTAMDFGADTRNVQFSGSYESVNEQMSRFIEAVKNEQRQRQDIQNTADTQDLAKATRSLDVTQAAANAVGVNLKTALETAGDQIKALVSKNWVVNVSAPGASVTGDVMSTINKRL